MQGNNVKKSGNSTAGNCQARKLIAATRATQKMLDQTIEIENTLEDQNVIIKTGKYGVMAFIRSKFSYSRFFVASQKHGESWKCTCGGGIHQNGVVCPHIKNAWLKIDIQKEEVA